MEVFHSNFVLTLLQDVIDRCKSSVIDEVVQVVQFDTHEELNNLEGKLSSVEKLLDSFKPTANDDWQHWQGWVEKVTGVSYDTEDLVDDLTLDCSNNNMFSTIWSILSRRSMGRKIQGLQDKLEEIINELHMFNRASQQTQQRSSGSHNTHKHFMVGRQQRLHPELIFGREKDKEEIMNLLLGGEKKIISIVGMDGLGKTSLAKYVLDDSRIRDMFDEIVWVSVNDKFKLEEMIYILERRLQGENARRTVLIVLDDLWEVNDNEWREFRYRFPNPYDCKVLLTTNYLQVAEVTESDPYLLLMVEDEDCEKIISKARFSYRISELRCKYLKDIAQKMAPKCKGLPVVADILGRVLSSKLADKSNYEWKSYPTKDISELGILERIFYPPRYLCLELHLKKCLAYCALFPREYDFKKDDLVQLWMAEDFLRCKSSTRSVEQVGNEYFDELLSRSVFHRSDRDDQESYNMHEFMHRLAESMASYTCCQLKKVERSSSVRSFNKARHLSFLCDRITPNLLKKIEECDGLRTLLSLNNHVTKIGLVPYSLFQKLRRLRVLDLSRTDIQGLPESLGRLTNLQYLDASETRIKRLPDSASKLHRLQVLKLRDCDKFRRLPKDMKKLTNVRHLDVNMKSLTKMPQSIGRLSYLKTLSFFSVGKQEGYRITELGNLDFLCGTVCLANLENVEDGAEAWEAKLRNKASIKRLELKWKSCSDDESIEIDILASLQPHQYLEELEVINYGGSSFPAWLTSTSHMLVSIHMQNCQKIFVLPSLGQLPCLKRLHVEGLDLVQDVDYRFCGEGTAKAFPSLESLSILNMKGLLRWYGMPEDSMSKLRDLTVDDCPNLSSIESLKHMNTLKTLVINHCQRLIELPVLPDSIEELIIEESYWVTQNLHHGGYQWCSIRNIPSVVIDGNEVIEDVDVCIDP